MSDFKSLSTANLPDPAIDPAQGSSPDQYFDVGIWTGDGVNGRNIPDLFGHTPDWVWIKNRSAAIDHNVADVLRGWKELYPNLTNAEGSQQMNAPTNDGLSGLPASNGYNNNGNAYVAWAWKANGSGVSNTDGTITSTVSANTESGFSIVTFTGVGSASTVGHGLNSAPDWIVFMRRDGSGTDHVVYHSALGATKNLRFNNTDAVRTQTFFNDTEPTSSVFSVDGTLFADTRTFVAYCFHSVEGFSKFGSYEGTNNADGPFIYLGFRPKFFLLKNVDSALNWIIFDDERDPYNVVGKRIFPNLSNAESAVPSNSAMDFLSNGVKIKVAGGYDINDTGTYIYMAFAENPFKYSNAR